MEKYFEHLEHQDWKTIVVNKKKKTEEPKKRVKPDSKIKNIEKKVEADDLKHKKITPELKQQIIQTRCSLSLTQKQ